jgi:hypothetical protein
MKFPYIKIPQKDPTKKWISRPLIPVPKILKLLLPGGKIKE